MSYKAICVRLTNVMKHPNADRLQLATVCGEQVVVGLENKEGDLGVYFATDGQLSAQFAEANDLVSRVDDDGKRAGGFFPKTRQVRAQNFRGARSDGYWCPVEAFSFIDGALPCEGDEFDTWWDVPICNKYVTEATAREARKQGQCDPRKKNPHFPEHIDTKHLERVGDMWGLVIQTEKLHGTSQRFGNVLEEVPVKRTILDRLLRRQRYKQEYRYVLGTRRKVLKSREEAGFYGNEEFRWIAVRHLEGRLKEGEILYGEVVGYTCSGKPIMAPHDGVPYHYGCKFGECRFFVYRITQHGVELPWFQVQKRCYELGISTVPLENSWHGFLREPKDDFDLGRTSWGHIREGCVYRVEGPEGYQWIKSKTYEFKVAEGLLKTDENYVDTEESA